jgi:hypothetical protein
MDPNSQSDVPPMDLIQAMHPIWPTGRKAMRSKIRLMVLIFTTALVLHVTAQSRVTKEPFDTHGHSLVSGQGAKTPVALCTGPMMATDGTAKCLYQALPVSGILRIEMQDGTIREIDLESVKKMTVSDR